MQLHGFNFLVVEFEIELPPVLALILEDLVKIEGVEDLVSMDPFLHDVLRSQLAHLFAIVDEVIAVLQNQFLKNPCDVLLDVQIDNIVDLGFLLIDIDIFFSLDDFRVHRLQVNIEHLVLSYNVNLNLLKIIGLDRLLPLGQTEDVLLLFQTGCQLAK